MDRYTRSNLSPTNGARHAIKDEIYGVLIFLGVVWAAYFLDYALPLREWFALVPRHVSRLPGIVAMPFLHESLRHLLGNTVPLFVLLLLLAGSRARSWEIVAMIVVLNGSLLWLVGRSGGDGVVTSHVGASGLIFGLIGFLIASGFFERRLVSILIAIIVGFFFGGTLIANVLPKPDISWEGHWLGVIAGVAVAYVLTRKWRGSSSTTPSLLDNPQDGKA